MNKTGKNYMYLDKYIEAAFKMWNVFKTDSVLIAPEVEFLGTKHCYCFV